MKLQLKHLTGYLPYRLKMLYNNDFVSPKTRILSVDGYQYLVDNSKPILRPLSDLTDEDTIEFYGLGSVELELIDIHEWTEELIQEIKTVQKFKLSQFEYLFSRHFDIFGLIEKGLAIDINKL